MLKRKLHKMPMFVQEALKKHRVMDAYKRRPPYQQNDYLGWIIRAKRPETQQRRLNQMVAELKKGDKYMNMAYKETKLK